MLARPAVQAVYFAILFYDRRTAWAAPFRHLAVDALELRRGEVVLEVGCGTGLNFARLEDQVGRDGRLLGIDACPAMLALAGERVARAGWQNVELQEAPAEEAQVPPGVDAVLFCATHDLLRSPRALENILSQLAAGSRVVAAGPKWVPWWVPFSGVLNFWVSLLNRPYAASFEGFECPWDHLARLVEDLEVCEGLGGSYYIARGRVSSASMARGRGAAAPPSWS